MQKADILGRIEDAGVVKGIELTFTVPHADQVIGELVAKYGDTDAVIGAGTVLDAPQQHV